MFFVVVFLKKEEYLDEVVEALVEAEIKGLSIVDGVEMEKVLAVDIPIFAGLVRSMGGMRGANKVLFGITKVGDNIKEFISILRDIDAPEDISRLVEVISLPVSDYLSGD